MGMSCAAYDSKIADAREEAEGLGLPPATKNAERVGRMVYARFLGYPWIKVAPTVKLNGGVAILLRNRQTDLFAQVDISPEGKVSTIMADCRSRVIPT